MAITFKTFQEVTDELLDILADLDQQIFEKPYPREKIAREATTKHNFSAIVAYSDETPCAFKAGYEMTARLYYSWIGGVASDYRGAGIAKTLMAKQHELAKELHYQTVRTHTENRFREMLILNIKSGFEIIGVSRGYDGAKTIIMLEKELT